MDADGSNVKQLTHTKIADAPRWSPDGQHIALKASLGFQGRQAQVMDADGTHRRQVSEPIPNAVMFVKGWSPDGTQILYKASIHALLTHASVFIATLNAAKGGLSSVSEYQSPRWTHQPPLGVPMGSQFSFLKKGERGGMGYLPVPPPRRSAHPVDQSSSE